MTDELEHMRVPAGETGRVGCTRVRDMVKGENYGIDKVVECSDGCGWPIIVSKQGVAFAEANPGTEFICMQCAVKSGAKFQGAVYGSVDAVVEQTGRPREQVAEEMRRMMAAAEIVRKAREQGAR